MLLLKGFFSYQKRPDRLWAHPASNSKGTLVSYRGLSGRGLEVNLSKPPSSSQVKIEWISASASPTGLHDMDWEYFYLLYFVQGC